MPQPSHCTCNAQLQPHDRLPGVCPEPARPEWRQRLIARTPTAAWWLRRHHCTEDVIGG